MKEKIFVVDDELEIVEMVKLMLETENYETGEAYSGDEALNTLKNLNQEDLPDLILLDIMMKPMNGWETLENIKKNEKLRNIPVSMLTLVPLSPETMAKEDIENIENYITKPFTKEELLRKVDEVIGKKKRFKKTIKLIENKAGDKLVKEYKRLFERISRHQFLMEALEKTAEIEGRKSYSMRITLDNEKKMISIWNRKMEDIVKQVGG